ncbi:MAG TPA: energy transducer TonB, partial [bacterium]|nr:energy transducer TonB [bacterium]
EDGAGAAAGRAAGPGVAGATGESPTQGMDPRSGIPPSIPPHLTPPRVITSAGTVYPADALRIMVKRQEFGSALAIDAAEGTVGLRALVLADGTVDRIDVTVSSGSAELDHAAIEAVKRWQFAPARRDGVPIDAYVTLRIRYVVR